MKQKVYTPYSFPLWAVFVTTFTSEMPIPYVEMSVDGNAVYIEPTEKDGLVTIGNLKKIREIFPRVFSNVAGEVLVDIPTLDELSQLLSKTEKLMNIKINSIAHTLRFSKELNTFERVLVPVEKFLNPLIAVKI
jgi:hypothetical protein